MKRILVFPLITLLLIACGKSNSKQLKPTTGDIPTPTSTPNPSSGLKWSNDVLSSETEACAQRGTGSYSLSQWRSFCGCVYGAAAKIWTYEDFANNFDEAYDQLSNSGVIDSCLSKAGIN